MWTNPESKEDAIILNKRGNFEMFLLFVTVDKHVTVSR